MPRAAFPTDEDGNLHLFYLNGRRPIRDLTKKINRAIVGVDNLGDPLRFNVFFGLPRSSAPTRFDVYLKRAIVGSGFHTRPKKITQKITSGALPDATGFDEYLNQAILVNA